MAWIPRLTSAGMSSSRYYLYIYGTQPFSNPLPNCTAYAYGRRMENACEVNGGSWSNVQHYSNPYWWRDYYATGTIGPNMIYGNAYTWFSDCAAIGIFSQGSVPQVGAIACFGQRTTEGGHVSIVEEVNADGTVTLSMSENGGQYFKVLYNQQLVVGSSSNFFGGVFQGYIYNNFEPVPPSPSGDKILIYRRNDKVKIIKYGNANSYGTGRRAYGIGWTRTVKKVWEGRPYPYQVGFRFGGTTGFYKADALQLISRG